MNDTAPLRRTRRIVLVSLAILGVAGVLFPRAAAAHDDRSSVHGRAVARLL
jgi:hypothetical protein